MTDAASTTVAETRRTARWAWLLIVAVTLVAYFPALGGSLLWNDSDYVTTPALRSLHGLGRIWFEPGATQQYYPVLHTAFWVEHRMWGDATFGYHLVNVLLHATSACLLLLILRRLAVPGALFAALLFALHPVCVESVAWISEQKNTLSTALYMAALLVYLTFDERRGWKQYAPATGLYLLALLSKSVTASLPAALLVIIWWRRGRIEWRRDVIPLLPWFVVGAAVGLFTGWVERTYVGAEGADFNLSLAQRFLVAGRAVWFYLGKLLWPADLMFIYPRWTVDAAAVWQYAYPLAALGALGALGWLRHRTRAPLVAALLFSGTLFPTLGFFNVYAFIYSYVADHWQYLACLGVIAPAAAGLTKLSGRWPQALRWTLATMLGGGLGVLTWRQCGGYRDITTFYRTILARNPECWLAHNNLGNLLLRAGRPQEAIPEYETTLRLKPDFLGAIVNLADVLLQQGDLPGAAARYEQALRVRPDFGGYLALARLLARLNRPADAVAHVQAALQLQPNSAEAHRELGDLFLAAGRREAAVDEYQQALRFSPDDANLHNNLGFALMECGRLTEAAAQYERGLQLQPDLTQAHVNLAVALVRLGRVPEAITHLQAAERLQPNLAPIHRLLGDLLTEAGRTEEARLEYELVGSGAAPAP